MTCVVWIGRYVDGGVGLMEWCPGGAGGSGIMADMRWP